MLNNAKGQNELLLDLKAATIALLRKKAYIKASTEVLEAMFTLHAFAKEAEKGDYPKVKHPAHDLLAPVFEEHIRTVDSSHYADFVFGDSMTDMAREWLTAFDGIYSISGSWSHHMLDMYKHLREHIIHRKTNSVSIGTLAGNPLLLYRHYDDCLNEAINTLEYIRDDLPSHVKLIVFGCPASYNANLAQHTLNFDIALMRWVKSKHNTYFLSLKRYGEGAFGLVPDPDNQKDALHFNPYGARRFNRDIKRVINSNDPAIRIYV